MPGMLNFPSSVRCIARPAALCVAAAFAVTGAGCAQQGPVYGWSHPSGGEYLFAFDRDECSGSAASAGKAGDAFFDCMKERGYLRVDPDTGEVLAEDGESTIVMAPGFTQAGR
jgi:hypothetical protein